MFYQSVPQECRARVSGKSLSQECPIKVSHKSTAQEYATRVSQKSVLHDCPRRVSSKSVSARVAFNAIEHLLFAFHCSVGTLLVRELLKKCIRVRGFYQFFSCGVLFGVYVGAISVFPINVGNCSWGTYYCW